MTVPSCVSCRTARLEAKDDLVTDVERILSASGLAHEDEVGFDVIERLWRNRGTMAVVVAGIGAPSAGDVRGIISKEHVPILLRRTLRNTLDGPPLTLIAGHRQTVA